MYDIRDVLKKGVEITNKRKQIFEKARDDQGDVRIRMVMNVLIKSTENDIAHYEHLIEGINDEMAEDLDFAFYDKISSLINQFSRTIVGPNTSDRKELIKFAIEQENSVYALILDIQGRLVMDNESYDNQPYNILSEVIEEKRKLISQLENMVKAGLSDR
ncbi:MAG: hypothetical protein IBX70_05700 [Clostridia bacterium]|nr:hypothetical protein [Clostridia bacterium]